VKYFSRSASNYLALQAARISASFNSWQKVSNEIVEFDRFAMNSRQSAMCLEGSSSRAMSIEPDYGWISPCEGFVRGEDH
jgi:hypothetical protein